MITDATIAEDDVVIQVITFDVVADKQDDLVAALITQTERWIRF